MTSRARWLLALLTLVPAVVVGGIYAQRTGMFSAPPAPDGEARLPSFANVATWFNGGPVSSEMLRGHVTVVVVWSDADPRSLRALPDVQGWYGAYSRLGVQVVGVFAPDFAYGTDPVRAERIVKRLGLGFPIALDPGYELQSKLVRNGDRPAFVIADTLGRIVHRGGGSDLAGVDHQIRKQLRALHPAQFPDEPEPVARPNTEPPSRFVFLGSSRVTDGPLLNADTGRAQTFTAQFRYQEEGKAYVPYPVGRWTPTAEGIEAARGGAATYVAVRYDGGHVMAVLQPPAGATTRVWVLSGDEWVPSDRHGDDLRADARGATYIDVDEPRLYSVARGAGEVLRLSPETPGLTVYSFTFEPDAPPRP